MILDRKERISIHALLAESDAQQRKHAFERLVFLSTLSLRRATLRHSGHSEPGGFLSTLSLRRATITAGAGTMILPFLSTLSLRRATTQLQQAITAEQFLSTLSLRRATLIDLVDSPIAKISIHALLAESDGPHH